MPRRKSPFPVKPHVMDPAIRRKFQAFIDQGKPKPKPKEWKYKPKWGLWRWDTLEDVPQD
jgi:hypothetical protein